MNVTASIDAGNIEEPFDTVRNRHQSYLYPTPTDLAVTKTTLKRVLVVGSCFANSWGFQFNNPSDCECEFVLTNNLGELSEAPPKNPADYDFQIVQLPFRSIAYDREQSALAYGDLAGHEKHFNMVRDRLALQLRGAMAWNSRYGLLTFVSNFVLPQQNSTGRMLPRYDLRNQVHFVERVNAALEELLHEYSNSYVLDLDKLSAIFGRMYIQDDAIYLSSHASALPRHEENGLRIEPLPSLGEHYENRFQELFRRSIWAEAVAMYRTVRQFDTVKLIIVDLDDTLWKGVSGDRENIGPDMIEGWPLGIIEALCQLKKRGVLLAIASKNDEERVRAIWDQILGQRLRLDDFAAIKINWRPKEENVAEILSEVNLLPRNAVFIDDNPVERASITHAFPDIRVLGRYPYYLRRILLWSSETQVATITDESSRRTEMIHAQIERESSRKALSRHDFLNSLALKVRFFLVSDVGQSAFSRVFELINKTNQFNTTGRRWKHETFVAAFAGGKRVYAFEVADKYSDYGLVGIIIVDGSCIEQFVMSCRVVGLDIEVAVLAQLIGHLRQEGFEEISANFARTDANSLCRDLYSRAGFVPVGDNFAFAVCDDNAPRVPSYIELEDESAFPIVQAAL